MDTSNESHHTPIHTMNNFRVGKALEKMLKNNKRNKVWFSIFTGIPQSSLSHIFAGRHSISLEIILKLSKKENLKQLVAVFIAFYTYTNENNFYQDIENFGIKNPSQD